MSAEAEGWVWKHSPYKGAAFQVHLAVADVVNDMHGWEFWAANAPLAAKARVGRQACNQALRRMVADGLLEVLWSPPAGKPAPVKYRFLMPTVPVVWPGFSDFRVAMNDTPKALTVSPETTRRVAVDDSSVSPETTQTQEVTQALTQGATADKKRQAGSPSSRSSSFHENATRDEQPAGLTPCPPSPPVAAAPSPAADEARRIAERCAADGKATTQVRLMVPVLRALLEKGEDPQRLEKLAMGLRTITEGTMGVALDRADQREQQATPVLKARPGPPPPPVYVSTGPKVSPEERATALAWAREQRAKAGAS